MLSEFAVCFCNESCLILQFVIAFFEILHNRQSLPSEKEFDASAPSRLHSEGGP